MCSTTRRIIHYNGDPSLIPVAFYTQLQLYNIILPSAILILYIYIVWFFYHRILSSNKVNVYWFARYTLLNVQKYFYFSLP